MKIRKIIAIASAAAIVLVSVAGCSGNSEAESSGANNAAFEFAKAKVSAFSSGGQRISAIFTDECFSKANVAALLCKDDTSAENLEQIARYLYLDSITIADETGVITACYPEGEAGKKLKETSDKSKFNKIVKGMSVKLMNEPVPVEDSTDYNFMVGVSGLTKDNEPKGAVVIGFTSSEYAATTGEELADSCGVNVIVAADGEVISSTLDGADNGAKLSDLGLADEDISKGEFTAKIGDKEYDFKAEAIDTYTLIVANAK